MSTYKENRIDLLFRRLRAADKKAFIPFITAGDPSVNTSYRIAKSMIENGADLLEFGVSLPGPVRGRPGDHASRRART